MRINPLPTLDSLPLHAGDPPTSAWGLWGDSKDASLGSLNYLTDDLVLKTLKEEVKTGERVGLEYVKCQISPQVGPVLTADLVFRWTSSTHRLWAELDSRSK